MGDTLQIIHPELLGSRPVKFTKPVLLSTCEGDTAQKHFQGQRHCPHQPHWLSSHCAGPSGAKSCPAAHYIMDLVSAHSQSRQVGERETDTGNTQRARAAETVYSTENQRPKSQATCNFLQHAHPATRAEWLPRGSSQAPPGPRSSPLPTNCLGGHPATSAHLVTTEKAPKRRLLPPCLAPSFLPQWEYDFESYKNKAT